MKTVLLKAAVFLLAAAAWGRADLVFDETFDSPIYQEEKPIPTGPGVLRHGEWNGVSKSARPGYVAHLEKGPVLELHATEAFKLGTRAIGQFGVASESSAITSALKLKLFFMMTKPLGPTLYIQILGGDGKSRATVGMNEDGVLTGSFGGNREEIGGKIVPNRWYWLEFVMPKEPRTKSSYTINLYEADGVTAIASKSGVIARSVEADGRNYVALDVQHRAVDASLFLDHIQATTGPDAAP